ncbi:MAG: TM0106 family RecB-like putative nuclease [Deltaproteobacteria bacterium]|nr:TM0106 family RecB-like putative nuclease [Deltaproteobacteria bacterium]
MTKQPITLEALIQRATAGKKFNRHDLFRPSLSYYLVKDPFWLWCEHHAPKDAAVDETTRYEKLRMQQGLDYEARWVETNFPDAVEIKPGFGFAALKNTLRAMLDGAATIYQPQLWDLRRDSYGKGDLLIRDHSAPSDLGPFHYRVVEIKRSAALQISHILQASFYNQNLALLQGYCPPQMIIVLKDSSETVAYDGKEMEIDAARQLWRSLREGSVVPEAKRPPNAASSPWRLYANQRLLDEKDLLLLAGIQKREREKLRQAGIQRVDWLWNLRLEEIVEIIGARHGESAYHVGQAYKLDAPVVMPGKRLNIPRAKRRLYFDFETSDSVHPSEPPHTYLIGCYDAGGNQFVKFLARGAEDEERIFGEFFDYIGDPREVCLYHWTDFEIHQMRAVVRRWPLLAGMIEQIIDKCVDLKSAIQSAVYLPVPSFSIKSVAPALGFHWRQKEFGAYQSMVCYWDYLDNADLFAIDRALIYNEDDCKAMWHVDEELSRRLKL